MESGTVSFMYPTLTDLPDAEEVKIEGNLPEWLDGASYIRTGPGHFDFEDNFAVNHFLDGYAILTRFQIYNNKMKYDRKFLQTDAYKKALIAQKPVIAEFGTKGCPDPTKNILSRFIPNPIEMSDNCNVCLFNIGNDLFAGADTCMFRKVDPKTLDCGDKFDTLKPSSGENSYTGGR